jgi:hypothetical protein
MPRIKRGPDPEHVNPGLHISTGKKLIAFDAAHWRALYGLKQALGQPTTTATIRFLVRARARELGCWQDTQEQAGE